MSDVDCTAKLPADSEVWKEKFYDRIESRAASWLQKSDDPICILSNFSALVFSRFSNAVPADVVANLAESTLSEEPDAKLETSSKSLRSPVNWAGFYLLRPYSVTSETAPLSGSALFLGPFCGEPAVPTIPIGRGVVGSCAAGRAPEAVPNVHHRPDHIACDPASRSELVVPLFAPSVEGDVSLPTLLGVLDIDSPYYNLFSSYDVHRFTRILLMVSAAGMWEDWPLPVRLRETSDAAATLANPDGSVACSRH